MIGHQARTLATGLRSGTVEGKSYVLQHANSGSYWTWSKGRSSKPRGYWGLYIGREGERYGAERYGGGPTLDALLAEPRNQAVVAVEVDRRGK